MMMKKYFKIYPDTDIDYSTVLRNTNSAIYGTTDPKWGSNRVQHTIDVIVPVMGPANVDNGGNNYFDLQDLQIEQYQKLQYDTSKNLKFGDGLPFAYIEKPGFGNFRVKIENNSSSETFDEFEIYLSTKPFTELTSLSDALDITIKVAGSEVSYVPKDTEATISFKLEDKKKQLYLWWQAKNETYGGMLTEASDINWTIRDD